MQYEFVNFFLSFTLLIRDDLRRTNNVALWWRWRLLWMVECCWVTWKGTPHKHRPGTTCRVIARCKWLQGFMDTHSLFMKVVKSTYPHP